MKQKNKEGGDIISEDLTELKRNITTKCDVISCSLVDMYNPEHRSRKFLRNFSRVYSSTLFDILEKQRAGETFIKNEIAIF